MTYDDAQVIRDLVRLSKSGPDDVKKAKKAIFGLWVHSEYGAYIGHSDADIMYDKAVSIFQDKTYAGLYAGMVCDGVNAILGGAFVKREAVLYIPHKKPMDALMESETALNAFSFTTVPRERKPETWANEHTKLIDYLRDMDYQKELHFWAIQRDPFEERVNAILYGHSNIHYLTTQNENAVRNMLHTLRVQRPMLWERSQWCAPALSPKTVRTPKRQQRLF